MTIKGRVFIKSYDKRTRGIFKAIKDYSSTSCIQELIKVANILQAEIIHRADFGEMYR